MADIATLEGNIAEDIWDWIQGTAQGATNKTFDGTMTYAKAKAAALTIATITGVQPTVIANVDGSYTIKFLNDQKDKAVAGFNSIIAAWKSNKSTNVNPGIKYDLSNVIIPVIIRQAMPYIFMAAFGGGVAFYLYKQSQKKKG